MNVTRIVKSSQSFCSIAAAGAIFPPAESKSNAYIFKSQGTWATQVPPSEDSLSRLLHPHHFRLDTPTKEPSWILQRNPNTPPPKSWQAPIRTNKDTTNVKTDPRPHTNNKIFLTIPGQPPAKLRVKQVFQPTTNECFRLQWCVQPQSHTCTIYLAQWCGICTYMLWCEFLIKQTN